MALYDDSDEDYDDYPGYNKASTFGANQNYGSYGGQRAGQYGSAGGLGGGGISYGAASAFGGGVNTFSNDPLSMPGYSFGGGGGFGGDPLQSDYVDLSKVKAPDVNKFQPNKFATSKGSSMRKPGKKAEEPRGVSFGDVTTFHVDKESNITDTDKKSKSDPDDDEDEDDSDEDEIQNEALKKAEKEIKNKEVAKSGVIASMLKKMADLGESVTESGSMPLKKSIDSEEYKISSSNEDFRHHKLETGLGKNRSPSGLTDSNESNPRFRSRDHDSLKKSSEYDSAELSRNFNYDESEELAKSKPKSDKGRKSVDETEYDDDFESTSNLHESSSMAVKLKKSVEKIDEIEEIRKRNMEYKSNLETFNKGLKSKLEHEEDISYKDESPMSSKNRSSVEEKTFKSISKTKIANDDLKLRSLENENQELTQEKYNSELEAKKHQMDAQVSQMEAKNVSESNKRMQEKMLGYVQDINMYRVEIEGLKRQIDIADANAKDKELEVDRVTHEYESRLQQFREKHVNQVAREEAREVMDLKRENKILKETIEHEKELKFEEVDYLTKR